MATKKEKSTFKKITTVVIWVMLIAMVGMMLLSAVMSVMNG